MVRLKDVCVFCAKNEVIKISIPYGAIKSCQQCFELYYSREFQFLMVRLKGLVVHSSSSSHRRISIPYGAIKSP